MGNTNLVFLAAAVCLCFSHCASTDAPSGWLPEPDQLPSDSRGAWISIDLQGGKIRGELVAIGVDSVFVADTTLHSIPLTGILSARLVRYNAGQMMGGATFFGALLTISNGLFLVFTMPMWLIGGTIAATSRSFDPIIDCQPSDLKSLAPWARFPQGLPPDLERSSVRMKVSK